MPQPSLPPHPDLPYPPGRTTARRVTVKERALELRRRSGAIAVEPRPRSRPCGTGVDRRRRAERFPRSLESTSPRKHRQLLAAVACTLLAVTGLGCSAPIRLEGDPNQHGVLVLDAEVNREFILGIVVGHHVDDGSIVRTDRLDERIPGTRVGSKLVFSALEPGTYAIARVTTESSFWSNWDAYPYAFRYRDLPEDLRSMEVRAGEATMVGPVTVYETSGFSGIETTIEWRGPSNEDRRALSDFQSTLEPGAWADAIDAQLRGSDDDSGEDDE